MNSCLLLYTKPARPGRVKTRLVGDLSAEQTAALHAAFLDDVVSELRRGAFELVLAWALDLEDEPPSLPGMEGLRAVRQSGDDLGARLYGGLEEAARQCRFVAAVGSDHPELTAERVEEAFAALEQGAPVVLGPSDDGGYYLVGARREALSPKLFSEIPWSTSEVFEATLDRCRELGLEPAQLPVGFDVDYPQDLERLVERLRQGESRCEATRAVLRDFGYDL